MKVAVVFCLSILICECYGVIYKLNDTEYYRMPPVFHLDDYDHCLTNPEGIYCTANIDIVSDTRNELYIMMRNYSDYFKKHYNHTHLRHGICVTQICHHHLQNKTWDLKLILEACLNETLWRNHQLKCRVTNPLHCNTEEDYHIDGGDLALGVFLLVLLTMNIVGSLYDIIFVKGKNISGDGLLLCFSVPYNFSRLATSYGNLEPREERLKVIHGLRTMSMMGVIYCHALLPFSLLPENVRHVEMIYDNLMNFIFINGNIAVQTFFILSGCLLSYKLEIISEKRDIKWSLLPRAVLMTLVKLSPTNIVMVALAATWLRHAGSGPLWEVSVRREVEDCRNYGWTNLVYLNNYLDHTQCMEQTWYLAANMQLCILGYAACILAKGGKLRRAILILLFIVGLVTPMAHTYFQNLDALLMFTPESGRTFMNDPTFNHVYKRGHTNIANFVLGIALGFLIYRLQTNKVDMKKYQKYRHLFLLTVPGGFGCVFIGSIFYVDGFAASPITKALYAGLIKPTFGVMLAALIFGSVFKIDNVYRRILEWDGWKVPSRLCYCAYLVHLFVIRYGTGSMRTLVPLTNFKMIETIAAYTVLSFLAAVPLWLLVDAPLTGALQKLLTGRICPKKEIAKDIPVLNDVEIKKTIKINIHNCEEENNKF